jgi:hypothetical protein
MGFQNSWATDKANDELSVLSTGRCKVLDRAFLQLSLVVKHALLPIVYDHESRACSFVSHIYLAIT